MTDLCGQLLASTLVPVVRLSVTAIYEPVDNGWVQARIEELPGVITAAPSLDEAKELLVDALREYLLSLGPAEQPAGDSNGTREPLDIVIGA
jgi:predicted RNase H-like HicB family nuclease